VDRDSDLTIGDFWGIEHVRPEMDDGMGNSIVLLHTARAQEIWGQIQERMDWFRCEKEDILQPRLLTPSVRPKGRPVQGILCGTSVFSCLFGLIDAAAGIRRIYRKKKNRGNYDV
jgi:hypothetical protein